MKAHEDRLYEAWKDQVEAVLPSLLKKNLLIKPHDRAPPSLPHDTGEAEKKESEAGKKEEQLSLLLQYWYHKLVAAKGKYIYLQGWNNDIEQHKNWGWCVIWIADWISEI